MNSFDEALLEVIDSFPLFREYPVPDDQTQREVLEALGEGGMDLDDPEQVRALLVGLSLAMMTGVQGAIEDDAGGLDVNTSLETIQRGIGIGAYCMAYVVANQLRRMR